MVGKSVKAGGMDLEWGEILRCESEGAEKKDGKDR